jgi:hypothetical protein
MAYHGLSGAATPRVRIRLRNVKSSLLVALAVGALALIVLLWLRKDEAAPTSSAGPSAPTNVEPKAVQLAPAPASESVATSRESLGEAAPKSDLPLLRDLAAGPAGKSVEDPAFARKYDAMPAAQRRSAKDALERYMRSANSAGKLTAEEAAALSREIAWLEGHPGS